MTLFTFGKCMSSIKDKTGRRMIEVDLIPTIGIMTEPAISPINITMRVLREVAGSAIHGRPSELSVLMAGFTGNIGMLPDQFEASKVVVELGRRPGVRVMAGGTIFTKATGMWVVLRVTIDAGGGGRAHVCQGAGILMTT